MEIVELDFAFTFRTLHAHDRIKRGERDTHIARVRGDALLVLAENGVDAIVSVDRAAAEAELAAAKGYKHNSFKIELAKRAIVRALNTVAGTA